MAIKSVLSVCFLFSLCNAQLYRKTSQSWIQLFPGPWSPDLVLPHEDYVERQRAIGSDRWLPAARNDSSRSGRQHPTQFDPHMDQNAIEDQLSLPSVSNAARFAISFPQTCEYKNESYDCGFGYSCWSQNMSPLNLCSGWLVWSCCVPRMDPEQEKGGLFENPECGVTYLPGAENTRRARIVGGKTSTFGQHPWQVAIVKRSFYSEKIICGGSLIGSKFVVTAAHCVERNAVSDMRVRLGEHDTVEPTEMYPHEEYRIDRKIIHAYFSPFTYKNDIALLKLAEPVKFRKHILPICLPEDDSDNFVGENATVSGWGDVYPGHTEGSALLQEVDVSVIENSLCQRWLRSNGKFARIFDEMLCAGFEEGVKDSCQGDSGGPLSLKRSGRHQLIGIVSWGHKCGRPRAPGVYTRVSKYLRWIREKMEK